VNVRAVAVRASIAVLALGVALLAVELVLRTWTPQRIQEFASERSLANKGGEGAADVFTLDEELGYRPILGGASYGPFGTTPNAYAPEKPAGKRRLVFLGDSVTYRGTLQAGLASLLGDEGFEYWNAGVEGYSTAQEAAYYRRYLAQLEPDHVVLTFHLNDFEWTPVTFRDGEQIVRMYAKQSTRALNPWLLQHSFLYRWFLSAGAGGAEEEAIPAGVGQEIERALAELRDLVAARGGRLSVLVLPWLRPVAKWPGTYTARRTWILAALERLHITHYDFRSTLEAALAEGVQVMEKEFDPQHPSAEFGLRMARDLLARGFEP
jgi:lysophospholipase L1-like esterase